MYTNVLYSNKFSNCHINLMQQFIFMSKWIKIGYDTLYFCKSEQHDLGAAIYLYFSGFSSLSKSFFQDSKNFLFFIPLWFSTVTADLFSVIWDPPMSIRMNLGIIYKHVSDTALLSIALEILVSLQKVIVTTTFVQIWLSFVKLDSKIVLTVLIGGNFCLQ